MIYIGDFFRFLFAESFFNLLLVCFFKFVTFLKYSKTDKFFVRKYPLFGKENFFAVNPLDIVMSTLCSLDPPPWYRAPFANWKVFALGKCLLGNL